MTSHSKPTKLGFCKKKQKTKPRHTFMQTTYFSNISQCLRSCDFFDGRMTDAPRPTYWLNGTADRCTSGKPPSCFWPAHMFQILPSTSSFTVSLSILLPSFPVISLAKLSEVYFFIGLFILFSVVIQILNWILTPLNAIIEFSCAGEEPKLYRVSHSLQRLKCLKHWFDKCLECQNSAGICLSTRRWALLWCSHIRNNNLICCHCSAHISVSFCCCFSFFIAKIHMSVHISLNHRFGQQQIIPHKFILFAKIKHQCLVWTCAPGSILDTTSKLVLSG